MVLDETEWNTQKIPRVNKSKGWFYRFSRMFESFLPKMTVKMHFMQHQMHLKLIIFVLINEFALDSRP